MSSLNRFHWIAIACFLVTPIFIFVAIQSETNTQDIHTWLPNGTLEREDYDRFLSLFGHDDDILVSWPGCTIDDPRLLELTNRLEAQNRIDQRFRGIVHGAILLNELTQNGLGLSESAAKRRLAGIFLGPDERTTGIVLQLSPKGQADRKATLNSLWQGVDDVPGLDRTNIRLGGTSFVNAEIDRATNQSLLLSIPAIVICIVITLVCLRSLRLTVITLFVAGWAALASITLVTGLGFKINGLLVLMPVLVLVLTLSGCIHLCSYYRTLLKQRCDGDPRELAHHTLLMGWRPSCMAMLTTSIGILMLATSRIEAVRHFGWFSALSLVVALAVLLLLYPSLLAIWPASVREKKKWRDAVCDANDDKQRRNFLLEFRWLPAALLLLTLVAGPWMAFGLTELRTTLSPSNMFPRNSRVNLGHSWISENWTALGSIELVVQFPKGEGNLVDQLQKLTRIHAGVRRADGVTSAYSVVNLSPGVPGKRNLTSIAKRHTLNEKLEEHLPDLIDQRLIAEDEHHRYWRIHLGAGDSSDDDCDTLLAEIRSQAEQVAASLDRPPQFLVTGVWPLSVAGRRQLFDDIAFSFLMAFAIITPVVMLVLRGVLVGIVAMIPNVFPALMFFGGLGWLGVSIDIGTILTASVGLGIAVDDTLHFIEWFAREQRKTSCRKEAVRATVSQCARPMFFTTLICSAGLSLFVFSHFIPPRQFACAIVALLALALLCDLILLPALIIGPLGFVFRQDNRAESNSIDSIA